MSTPIEDGGCAFPMPSGPEPRHNEITHYNEGMALRDYFAAKAMGSMLQNSVAAQGEEAHERAEIAKLAYQMADAMLEARK